MYSFESSNDFDHKTVYVSDWTSPFDAQMHHGYAAAPLEPVYMFDDLYERFRNEIEYAHLTATAFQTAPLNVGRFYQNGLTSNYYYLRLTVASDGKITIQRAVTTNPNSSSTSWSNVSTCTKEQYQTGAKESFNGQIYFARQRSFDWNTGDLYQKASFNFFAGKRALYIGTWWEPSSSYPHGTMHYALSGEYVAPNTVPIMGLDQLGVPRTDTSALMNQPEILISSFGSWTTDPTYDTMVVSFDGSYDPDPDPPTPPGPGPSGDDPNDRDPEPSDKESTGGGPHTPHNDPLPIPGLPTVGAVSGGAFNVFKLTANEFNAFNGELYSDNAWTALKNYFNDPLDFMIGCIMVPAVAQSLGVLHPKFNSYVWSQAYARVIEQYVELNCGSIVCRAYYGSCFDYSPYTKVQLFLPFIGYVDLDPDEIMDMAVSIKYHIDVCTGDCVAFVSSALVSENARVIGQYNGNCGTQIPITRSNYDNVIAAGMNLLAASASAVGTYRAGGAAIGAASLTGASDAAIAGREIGLNAHLSSQLGAATMSAMAGSKSSVSRNGTLGGTCGLMGMLKPHLLVHTPRQSKPSNYMEMRGYPSNIGGVVGDFEGYLEVMDVRLNNIPATIDEINEIYELLKGGIII